VNRAWWGEHGEAEIMRAAAAAGQLQACKYLLNAGCEVGNGRRAVAAAALHGHGEVLCWLLEHGST
jgi:Ankyrin repeats (many copies)